LPEINTERKLKDDMEIEANNERNKADMDNIM